MCGDVLEEVEERFTHPSVRVHHERDEFLVHRCGRDLVFVVLLSLAFHDEVVVRDRSFPDGVVVDLNGWLPSP